MNDAKYIKKLESMSNKELAKEVDENLTCWCDGYYYQLVNALSIEIVKRLKSDKL
jgi:hypothetical protein